MASALSASSVAFFFLSLSLALPIQSQALHLLHCPSFSCVWVSMCRRVHMCGHACGGGLLFFSSFSFSSFSAPPPTPFLCSIRLQCPKDSSWAYCAHLFSWPTHPRIFLLFCCLWDWKRCLKSSHSSVSYRVKHNTPGMIV